MGELSSQNKKRIDGLAKHARFKDAAYWFARCLLFFLLASFACKAEKTNRMPKAKDGVLDLRAWDFEKDGIVNLAGEWAFYWQKLLTPKDFAENKGAPKNPARLIVPGTWRDQLAGDKRLPAYGYATYRLRIELGCKHLIYGLKINSIGTAYKLWVNGELLAKNGVVGKSEKTMVPRTLPLVVYNRTEVGTLDMVLQVSNYEERFGGPWDKLQLGIADEIAKLRDRDVALELIPLGIVLVMCLYHLLLFLLRRKEVSTLIFSLICMDVVLRISLMGERLLLQLFPTFNWHIAVKLEHLTLIFGPLFTAMYFQNVFKKDTSRLVVRGLQAFGCLYALFIIIFPPKIFLEFLPVLQGYDSAILLLKV